jgi:hypothetical protein
MTRSARSRRRVVGDHHTRLTDPGERGLHGLDLADPDEEEAERPVGGDEGRLVILGKVGIAGINP